MQNSCEHLLSCDVVCHNNFLYPKEIIMFLDSDIFFEFCISTPQQWISNSIIKM